MLRKTTLERKGQQQRRFTVPCLEPRHVARGASPPPPLLLSLPFFILNPPFVPDPFCFSAGWQSDIVGHGSYVTIHLLAGANGAQQQIHPLSAQMLVHTNKQRQRVWQNGKHWSWSFWASCLLCWSVIKL